MSTTNKTLFQLVALQTFLTETAKLKKQLLNELISNATNPTIKTRRYRILSQLSNYEHQIIQKIETLETDDPLDFCNSTLMHELRQVVSRNA